MSTHYTTGASKMAAGIQPRSLPYATTDVFSTFDLSKNAPASASGLALNDIIDFMTIEGNPTDPSGLGPTIAAVQLAVPSLDSSTGIVIDVGNNGGASGAFQASYISGATIGRSSTAGLQAINVYTGMGDQPFSGKYSSYTTVSLQTLIMQMKVTTGPTGTAAITGVITLRVAYTMDA